MKNAPAIRQIAIMMRICGGLGEPKIGDVEKLLVFHIKFDDFDRLIQAVQT